MPLINVRRLHNRTACIVSRVAQNGAEFVIYRQGRPVALLMPINAEAAEQAVLNVSRRSAMRRLQRKMQTTAPAASASAPSTGDQV